MMFSYSFSRISGFQTYYTIFPWEIFVSWKWPNKYIVCQMSDWSYDSLRWLVISFPLKGHINKQSNKQANNPAVLACIISVTGTQSFLKKSPHLHLHTPPNATCSPWYDHEWLKADYKPDSFIHQSLLITLTVRYSMLSSLWHQIFITSNLVQLSVIIIASVSGREPEGEWTDGTKPRSADFEGGVSGLDWANLLRGIRQLFRGIRGGRFRSEHWEL